MTPLHRVLMNAATGVRRLSTLFPGYFDEAKHNHYKDFGYPITVDFAQTHAMYRRNAIAFAAVEKTVKKTWETPPKLMHSDTSKAETRREREVAAHLDRLRFWQALAETDRRSLVGDYAGLILRFADNRAFHEPVSRVAGIAGLVEVIPAWQGQLEVSEWDSDPQSPTYGHPKLFTFNEAQVEGRNEAPRAFDLHPDRVVIWSRDGTVHDRSLLEPGFNDLLSLEKIIGAGGEGFWKNAKAAPVLTVDPDADIETLAKGMGVPVEKAFETVDQQVGDWQKGFDELLMLQGISAQTLPVSLPSPEHFFNTTLQAFAASTGIPLKILVGSQTGERASTEDAREWAKTCMARRNDMIAPLLSAMLDHFIRIGVLADLPWQVDWTDLTESDPAAKMSRADAMAAINDRMKLSGDLVFTADEIRAAAGYSPLVEPEFVDIPELEPTP